MVETTSELVEAARRTAVPVVWTVISYTPAEAEGNAIAWLDKAPGMRAMAEGSEAVDLDPGCPGSLATICW
ncbi:hypothetical protein NKH18_15465 [Streptomyces sp. M10(2022)]